METGGQQNCSVERKCVVYTFKFECFSPPLCFWWYTILFDCNLWICWFAEEHLYDNASSPSSPSYQDKAAAGDSAERELQIREWQDELEKVKAVEGWRKRIDWKTAQGKKPLWLCARMCGYLCACTWCFQFNTMIYACWNSWNIISIFRGSGMCNTNLAVMFFKRELD